MAKRNKKAPASDTFSLFVSYSRIDCLIVPPLVALLRVGGQPIFRDTDSIPPGTAWRFAIASAIRQCRAMLVLWCSHSRKSKEVRKEYLAAMELGKVVVPVLLDDTPLVRRLSKLQAVDMRPLLGAHQLNDDLHDRWSELHYFSSPALEREADALLLKQQHLAAAHLKKELHRLFPRS